MLTYLALGDSYTIGEQVRAEESFPFQTVRMLREKYFWQIADPVVIAKTGWTTDELMAAVKEEKPANRFDLVTLAIGVNNQYRGRSVEDYEKEFLQLLLKAILLAKGRPERVFVLSVPDWGVTPFAKDRSPESIAKEIDAFNKKNKAITFAYKCTYLDITQSTREHGGREQFLTPDRLHYSPSEYQIWAEKLSGAIALALR